MIPLHNAQCAVGSIGTNGFGISGGQRTEASMVDPGNGPDRMVAVLESASLRCAAVLITHGHFDHVGAIARNARGTTTQVYIRNSAASRPNTSASATPPRGRPGSPLADHPSGVAPA